MTQTTAEINNLEEQITAVITKYIEKTYDTIPDSIFPYIRDVAVDCGLYNMEEFKTERDIEVFRDYVFMIVNSGIILPNFIHIGSYDYFTHDITSNRNFVELETGLQLIFGLSVSHNMSTVEENDLRENGLQPEEESDLSENGENDGFQPEE